VSQFEYVKVDPLSTVGSTVAHVQDVYSVVCIGCYLSSSLWFALHCLDSGCMSDDYTVSGLLLLDPEKPMSISLDYVLFASFMIVADPLQNFISFIYVVSC